MNNEEISLLFALRCRTVRTIKANFSTMYNGNVKCQLGCDTQETKEHRFVCPFITQNKKRNLNVQYAHIFGTLEEQLIITKEFSLLLEQREGLLQERGASSPEREKPW